MARSSVRSRRSAEARCAVAGCHQKATHEVLAVVLDPETGMTRLARDPHVPLVCGAHADGRGGQVLPGIALLHP